MRKVHIFWILFVIGCSDNKQSANGVLNKSPVSSKSGDVKETSAAASTVLTRYKIYPVDESGTDPSLGQFISDLKAIAVAQDTAELMKSLSPQVVVGYGGGLSGRSEFSKKWKLDDPSKSELWLILRRILKLGGTWEDSGDEKYFSVPYAQSNKLFSKFNGDFDWFTTAICVVPDAKVLKEPKKSADVIGVLDYDLLRIDPDFTSSSFVKVSTMDEKIEGYVEIADVVYSTDPILVMKKIRGDWKITSFASFD